MPVRPPCKNSATSTYEPVKYGSIANSSKYCYGRYMKTTIDMPEKLLHRAKVVAAQRRTTLRELVLMGLDQVLGGQGGNLASGAAMARLEKGFRLGGKMLSREEVHARR